MEKIDQERNLVKRYLLGELRGEERERLEERYITDHEYREEVLMIENELIEEYLAGLLPDEEKERFTTHYLSTPRQIQKLKIAKAFNRHFSAKEVAPQPVREPPYRAKNEGGGFLRFRRFGNPLAALSLAALLLIISGISWVAVERWRQQGQLGQRQGGGRDFRQELGRLNNPRSPFGPADFTLTLSPVAIRGAGEMPRVTLPAHSGVAEVLLILPADEYESYRALLRREKDSETYVINGLKAKATDSGKVVSVKIPAEMLTRGDYLSEISGVTPEGAFEGVADYSFRISD